MAIPGFHRAKNCRWGQQGVTLLELLVAVMLLGMISTMIYSVLKVGIDFSASGEKHLMRGAKDYAMLRLLVRQVEAAWYDSRQKKVKIIAGPDALLLVTRAPFIYRDAGIVLAVYRYNNEENTLYYTEKRDFYNIDYNENYLPDFSDMVRLVEGATLLEMQYDEQEGEFTIRYGDKEYFVYPQCRIIKMGNNFF